MVGAVGIEPTTFGLKGRCSTTELRPCRHNFSIVASMGKGRNLTPGMAARAAQANCWTRRRLCFPS